jgi:hypothetical protein
MARQGWKTWAAMGLIAATGLVAGCTEQEARSNARQVGEEVGEAARGVRDATRGTVEGFQEGVGGSGTDTDIGDREGVIDDGEGPFEQPAKPGEKKTLLNDGEGPLDEANNR